MDALMFVLLNKGTFINYMDKIWANFDLLKCTKWTYYYLPFVMWPPWTFYWPFPPSSCPLSYWMTPKITRYWKCRGGLWERKLCCSITSKDNHNSTKGSCYQSARRTLHSLKFIYSEKATKVCEIFTLILSYVVPVKNKVKISQNFVAFSEYMNFKSKTFLLLPV